MTRTQREMPAAVARSLNAMGPQQRGCAYRPLLENTPLLQFGEMTANAALVRECQQLGSVDILDLGIDSGTQWPGFFRRLASVQPATQVQLVAMDDPAPDDDELIDIRSASVRAKKAATAAGILCDVFPVAAAAGQWPGPMIRRSPDLLINAYFSLHHIPDDGFGPESTRTKVLRRLRALNPKLLVVVEPDFGPPRASLMPRLGAAFTPGSSVLDALAEIRGEVTPMPVGLTDALTPPPSSGNTPAPIFNGRPERPDRLENWRRRFYEAGFAESDLSTLRTEVVRALAPPAAAIIAPERGALRLLWRGKPVVNVSAWRPV